MTPAKTSAKRCEGYGRGCGHVERAERTRTPDRHEKVAALASESTQASLLAADDEEDLLGGVRGELVDRRAIVDDRAHDPPTAVALGLLEGPGEVRDLGERDSFARSRRGTHGRGRQRGRPVSAPHHTSRTKELRAPDQGTEVVWVDHTIADEDEPVSAPGRGPVIALEQVLDVPHARRRGDGQHTAREARADEGIVDVTIDHLDLQSARLGELLDLGKDPTLLDEDATNPTECSAQELRHRALAGHGVIVGRKTRALGSPAVPVSPVPRLPTRRVRAP